MIFFDYTKSIACIICATILSSCNLMESIEDLISPKVASLDITDARYIFKNTPSATKSMSVEEEGYWKMTVNGALEKLNFEDENGKPLKIGINNIGLLGKHYLAVCAENGYYIVDKRTGKLYSYPSNAELPAYMDLANQIQFAHQQVFAIEYDDKLYLEGDFWNEKNSPNVKYFVELDVRTQTSTRCTPDGLNADRLFIANDGLLAFHGIDGAFVMTPDKKLKKYEFENHCFFTNGENNLFLIDIDQEHTYNIYSIKKQGESIVEQKLCSYVSNFPNAPFEFLFPINKANGNVLIIPRVGEILEFDGRNVVCVNEFFDTRDLEESYDFSLTYGLMHEYSMELPVDNLFFKSVSDNELVLSHLDLSQYEFLDKRLELFPKNEYTLIDNLQLRNQYIIYSCIRHSDSHIISYLMDYEGNRQEISDNNSSFSVSDFLILN